VRPILGGAARAWLSCAFASEEQRGDACLCSRPLLLASEAAARRAPRRSAASGVALFAPERKRVLGCSEGLCECRDRRRHA
jgi:hypothetical protein